MFCLRPVRDLQRQQQSCAKLFQSCFKALKFTKIKIFLRVEIQLLRNRLVCRRVSQKLLTLRVSCTVASGWTFHLCPHARLICFICTVPGERHTQQRWGARERERSANRKIGCMWQFCSLLHLCVCVCRRVEHLPIGRLSCLSTHGQPLWHLIFPLLLHRTSSLSLRSTHSWLSHTSTLAVWVTRIHFRFAEARPRPYKNVSPMFYRAKYHVIFLSRHSKPL